MPTRKPNRLGSYDYNQNGANIISICLKDRAEEFATVGPDSIRQLGIVVKSGIEIIDITYQGVVVDRYVIMPNHIHMIIAVNEGNGRMISAPTTNLYTKNWIFWQ